MSQNLKDALCIIGLVALVWTVFCLLKFLFGIIYTYVIGPVVNKVDFKSKGKWALVTGSTDGIGQEYAKQLAARGCDIILVSRSLDKLQATAAEIEREYKVSTKIIQVDFSENDEIYSKIANEIADLEIGTLVNNVGVFYEYPEYFLDVPDWDRSTSNFIRTNMTSVTRVTALVLPGMLKRGKGVVINISSSLSVVPNPLMVTYGATKAYMDKLTDGLDMEYGDKGIIFQCVRPAFVATKMAGLERSSLFAPTAETFVKSAIRLVGTTNVTTGYLPHAAQIKVINFMYGLNNKFTARLIKRINEKRRSEGLKKKIK